VQFVTAPERIRQFHYLREAALPKSERARVSTSLLDEHSRSIGTDALNDEALMNEVKGVLAPWVSHSSVHELLAATVHMNDVGALNRLLDLIEIKLPEMALPFEPVRHVLANADGKSLARLLDLDEDH
jgi:hypothetical protein